MTKQHLITAALSVALLISVANVSAYAAGITVGGTTIGGASGPARGNNANVNIGQGAGPLADVSNNGDPTGDGSTSDATINLGSLLSGLDLSAGDGTGNGDGTGVGGSGRSFSGLYASLSVGNQNAVKLRCRGVLKDPIIYKVDVLRFCRQIVKL